MSKSLHPALLLLLPPIAGGVFAALPIAPPGKITILSIVAGVFSVALLGLTLFDLFCPAPRRILIPFVWLAMSGGFVCLSTGLWTIAHTWGVPIQRLPLGKEGMLFCIMVILMFAGINGMFRAVARAGQVKAPGR